MQKDARNHVDEDYVVEFVPLFQVPNLPNGLDPFLQPLMNDLCEGFIEDYKVQYPKGITIPGFEQSNGELCDCFYWCGQLIILVNAKQGSFPTKAKVHVVDVNRQVNI